MPPPERLHQKAQANPPKKSLSKCAFSTPLSDLTGRPKPPPRPLPGHSLITHVPHPIYPVSVSAYPYPRIRIRLSVSAYPYPHIRISAYLHPRIRILSTRIISIKIYPLCTLRTPSAIVLNALFNHGYHPIQPLQTYMSLQIRSIRSTFTNKGSPDMILSVFRMKFHA